MTIICPGCKPVGHLVEFQEARRHTSRDAALRRDRVDLVHRRLQQVLQRDEVFRRSAICDVVDLGLRTIHDLRHVGALRAGIAVLNDPGARLHKAAQQRLLRDDARVVPGVGGSGHGRDQCVQIGRAADPAQQTPPVELRGHRHGVGRLATSVEVEDGVVDALMVGAVEVAGPQPLEDIGDGVLAQQHSAEHGLFGGLVLRRLAAEIFSGWWDVVETRATAIVHDSHGVLTSPPDRTYVRQRLPNFKPGPRQAQPPRRRTALRRPTLDVAGATARGACS